MTARINKKVIWADKSIVESNIGVAELLSAIGVMKMLLFQVCIGVVINLELITRYLEACVSEMQNMRLHFVALFWYLSADSIVDWL